MARLNDCPDMILAVHCGIIFNQQMFLLLQKSPYRVRGCILTVGERMVEEFTKLLQACDAHSTEYVDR